MSWIDPKLAAAALREGYALLPAPSSPEAPLARREREMIATVVSSANRCFS